MKHRCMLNSSNKLGTIDVAFPFLQYKNRIGREKKGRIVVSFLEYYSGIKREIENQPNPDFRAGCHSRKKLSSLSISS
jgi:hypothetical protein